MAISIAQQVDFLWKKLGYGVAKTAITSVKDATNESIVSSPFIPGDKIWVSSNLIPPVIPPYATAQVTPYYDGGANPAVACTSDITTTANRTWLTGLTDWIPIDFGSTYLVKVYLADIGDAYPQVNGIQLYPAGANNDDEWYFDYEAGVLNFIGENLPAHDFTGKQIYISGARYVGPKGISDVAAGNLGFFTITGDTISSSTGNINFAGGTLQNISDPVNPTDAATKEFVENAITSLTGNTISDGTSSVAVSPINVITTVAGIPIITATDSSVVISGVTISGNTISSSSVLTFDATSAFQIPTGTTLERPTTPAVGYVRFNTTLATLEYFNGTVWISSNSPVELQTLIGDGITDTFGLDRVTTSDNILVTVNGVAQTPDVAYVVNGNEITFGNILTPTDVIVVRYLSITVNSAGSGNVNAIVDAPNITVGTLPTSVDLFNMSLYASAKYLLSITAADGNRQMAEVYVAHNGISAEVTSTVSTMTGGGSTFMTFSTYILAGQCGLTVASSTIDSKVKLQKTYFTI